MEYTGVTTTNQGYRANIRIRGLGFHLCQSKDPKMCADAHDAAVMKLGQYMPGDRPPLNLARIEDGVTTEEYQEILENLGDGKGSYPYGERAGDRISQRLRDAEQRLIPRKDIQIRFAKFLEEEKAREKI